MGMSQYTEFEHANFSWINTSENLPMRRPTEKAFFSVALNWGSRIMMEISRRINSMV